MRLKFQDETGLRPLETGSRHVTPVPSGATKRSKLGMGAQDVPACGGHFLTTAL